MMKRGENGSISVSMDPSDVFVGLFLLQPGVPIPKSA
jgi:hypothetical protein